MSDQVLVVTPPDDVILDGFRLLLVDLDPEQSQVVSSSLLNISLPLRVILYCWNSNDDIKWLLDKKSKCNLIVFNANSNNDLIVGYLSGHVNSYYFGNLKLLAGANNSQLYAQEDCENLLEYTITKNGKF